MTWSDLITDMTTTIGESLGLTATVARGVLSDASVTVIEGRHDTEAVDHTNGISTKSTQRDWIIKVDQLTNLGTPQEGDTITVDGQTWEIMRLDYGDTDVEFLDHAENVARCHCRRIS